jgi:hypothetical protein
MATALLRTWNASGVLEFDSTQAQVGAMAETFLANYDGTGSPVVRTYPMFPGRNAVAVLISGDDTGPPTIDTTLGYPRVSVPRGYPTQTSAWAVFIV